eukprot:6867745-Prymnesium_polylepis.1
MKDTVAAAKPPQDGCLVRHLLTAIRDRKPQKGGVRLGGDAVKHTRLVPKGGIHSVIAGGLYGKLSLDGLTQRHLTAHRAHTCKRAHEHTQRAHGLSARLKHNQAGHSTSYGCNDRLIDGRLGASLSGGK